MNPYVLAILLSSLGLGTSLTFASSHWLLAWLGLEIDTLAFIPLMAQHLHPRAVEACTKYFLSQASAPPIIMFASTTNPWITGVWHMINTSIPVATTTIIFASALTIGLAAIHFSMAEAFQGLDPLTGLVLSTSQNLPPLALNILTAQAISPMLQTGLGVTSTLVGGQGGLNQSQLWKMLAYSSIAHMGSMIIILMYAPLLTLVALGTYIFATSAAFLTLKTSSATKFNVLTMSWCKSPTLTATSAVLLLSLGCLPPMTRFLPNRLMLQELAKRSLPITPTIMGLAALLSLYFWLRLWYAMTLTICPYTTDSMAPSRTPTTQSTLPLPLSTEIPQGLLPMTPAILMLTT
uniref:NADH-ubiquinone oxidoreductase chain 2 n=1 Tax=Danio albolineatus TaxID=27699 RepID=A0A140E9Z7_9TELE|nr:NADH dehydrogenase subunit 2 [Danio albolineatus]AMK97360.1 NADH dehydrogenase subunit 2 [Danio albolineatus]